MAEAYSNFAAVYDALMDNIPYDAWADYLHSLLVEYDISSGILAELGCGTGNITERMADFGYDMIGIDNSPAMLRFVGYFRLFAFRLLAFPESYARRASSGRTYRKCAYSRRLAIERIS